MFLNELTALSPIDGRYHSKTKVLSDFFSEKALFQYRVRVEIEYLIALCKIPLPQLHGLDTKFHKELRAIYTNFSLSDAREIKEIEKTTNHDIKAVEYFIKHKMETLNLSAFKEYVHFGLTSQDINNTAVPLSVKEAFDKIYFPELSKFLLQLHQLSEQWAAIPMLARTHGQPASPTRLGKEVAVFAERLEQQVKILQNLPFAAKFGGATGNFNAHQVAYPDICWRDFGTHFVEKILGLHYSFPTTQIEHYDYLAAIFDATKRINTILIDFNRDIWSYISMGYFQQKIKKGEIGSSAMPHKVNPIDFENAEGNLGIANALLEHLAAKLPVSRLQRDLTDSTVLRNTGVPFAHGWIALKSTRKGIGKLLVNETKINEDLEANWAVVAEAIQTILRRENYPDPYETLKELTRKNEIITKKMLHRFIDNLSVTENIKTELKAITPFNYTGI